MLVGLMGGQWTGTVVTTFEFDDLAAQGSYNDKILADSQIVKLMTSGADSPQSGFQSSLFVDVRSEPPRQSATELSGLDW
jgi:hypothetical protein